MGRLKTESVTARYDRWRLSNLLRRYPGLVVKPSREDEFVLRGELQFVASHREYGQVEDCFSVEISVARDFPESTPSVYETGGRVSDDFHTNPGGELCLGSPMELRMTLKRNPNLVSFVDYCVVPYFFSVSVWEKTGKMPFGELAHGDRGLLDDYRRILKAASDEECVAFLKLLRLKKRRANKFPCPCGSGKRVGCCHHKVLNRLRDSLGRVWLKSHIASLLGGQ